MHLEETTPNHLIFQELNQNYLLRLMNVFSQELNYFFLLVFSIFQLMIGSFEKLPDFEKICILEYTGQSKEEENLKVVPFQDNNENQ